MRSLHLLTLALLATAAKADTIVFDEAMGPLTVSGSSRLTNVSCKTIVEAQAFRCIARLLGPPGAVLVSETDLFSPGTDEGVAEPGFPPQTAADGGLDSAFLPGNTTVDLQFFDNFTPFIGFGACADGCPITEDGTFQTMGTITWSDGTVDTIQFHGETVPEPSSLVLFATGLIGIGLGVKRKITC
jgi:hypothetical protein